jgi:hypothetical protein
MNFAPAPKVATWLLKRLNSTPNNDALIGDLVEQYLQGRSRLWYWKQAFLAIVVSLEREISKHPVLTLRAVASGWAVIFLYRMLFRPSPIQSFFRHNSGTSSLVTANSACRCSLRSLPLCGLEL